MTAQATHRSPVLALAILAVLLAGGFTITDEGPQWFWADVPWLGVLLAVVGILLGVLHFWRRARAQA